MKRLTLSVLFLGLIVFVKATPNPTDYLPSFPSISYENIKFGKESEQKFFGGDACSSKSGGCSVTCSIDGCKCVCGPAGCSCSNPKPKPIQTILVNANKSLMRNDNNITTKITKKSINSLKLSADFFKNCKTRETDIVYMYMYRIASALNANDEKAYLSLVMECNKLTSDLFKDIKIAYNKYAVSNDLDIHI
jgi:hypothetical protein